jgi:phospholipase C
MKVRNYAVAAGDSLADKWTLADFENGRYHLDVNGPNGFFRSFRGDRNDPLLGITCEYHQHNNKPDGNIELIIANHDSRLAYTIAIRDHAYRHKDVSKKVPASGRSMITIDLSTSFGWYDFSLFISGFQLYERRFAGKVETGKSSFTDPAMGSMI